MKKVLFILSVIFLAACSKNNAPAHPNAKIKQIVYDGGNGNIYIIARYFYDSNDRIERIENPSYDNGQEIFIGQYRTYFYSMTNRLDSIQKFNYNLSHGYLNLATTVFEYDTWGKKTAEKEISPYSGNPAETTLFFYNGNLLSKSEYYDNAGLKSYKEYFYTAEKLTEEREYTSTGSPLRKTVYSYTNGLNTFVELYRSDTGEKTREVTKKYDSNGNLIRLESRELVLYSSMSSYDHIYEYY